MTVVEISLHSFKRIKREGSKNGLEEESQKSTTGDMRLATEGYRFKYTRGPPNMQLHRYTSVSRLFLPSPAKTSDRQFSRLIHCDLEYARIPVESMPGAQCNNNDYDNNNNM